MWFLICDVIHLFNKILRTTILVFLYSKTKVKRSCILKTECQYNMYTLQKNTVTQISTFKTAQIFLCYFLDLQRQIRSPNGLFFQKILNMKTIYKLFIHIHFLKKDLIENIYRTNSISFCRSPKCLLALTFIFEID